MKFSKVNAVRIPKGSAHRIRYKNEVLWTPPVARYVSFGDSIAAGHAINSDWETDYGWDAQYGVNGRTETVLVPGCYTDLIRQELEEQKDGRVITTSFARSGDKVSDLIEKLTHTTVINALSRANLVTICIGANDVLHPALTSLESYLQNGNPTLADIGQQVEANLKILNDDTNANSYKALLDRLYEINPQATYLFTNVYNPYKYLWIDESSEKYDYKDGFLGPLMWAIPETIGGLSNTIRGNLYNAEVVQSLLDRINGPSRNGSDGISAFAERYVSKLNEVLTEKVTAFGRSNFKVVDTKLLAESFPDRPVTATKHYNDVVSVEFTRGFNTDDMDWGQFWKNVSFSDITNNPDGIMAAIVPVVIDRVILPDTDPHPEEYGHYVLKRSFSDALGWESLARYTLAYNANGGTGSMASRTVLGIGELPAYTTIDPNTFTSPNTGQYFGKWNTSANGDGTSYTDKQTIVLTSSLTLYAQWAGAFTLSYYKIYNCDWPDTYPPASNSGPVSKNGSEYYLRVTVNGNVLPGLNDYFTEEGEFGLKKSPDRSIVVSAGSELYIQLINKGEYDRGAVYINDQKVAGNSEYCYYTMQVTQDMTLTFTWETENTVLYEPQSYWICRIYT